MRGEDSTPCRSFITEIDGLDIHFIHVRSKHENALRDGLDFFYKHGLGYAQEMAGHPQTLYGIEDSPIGLAAWIIDHDARSYELIARFFDGKSKAPRGMTSSTTSRFIG